jgi:hypothetical protein
MAPPTKYPKITKICPICSNSFETLKGYQREKTFCNRTCLGKSRIVDTPEKHISGKQRAREYRKNHPDLYKACKQRQIKKLKDNNPSKLICMEIRKRARKRGIPFEIEAADIPIPKTCPILGIELSFGTGRVHDASPSVDRIIPEKGYVKGNCFIISSKANRMKQENTLETLEKIVTYIKDRLPA